VLVRRGDVRLSRRVAPRARHGFLPCSNAVHYDKEPGRRPAFHAAVLAGMRGGYAAEDGAALHFVGESLARVVSSRPQARAYRVEASDRAVDAVDGVAGAADRVVDVANAGIGPGAGGVVERPLSVDYLGTVATARAEPALAA
jgi:hypothetical protein